MRNIDTKVIEKEVSKLFIDANYCLPADVKSAIIKAYEKEEKELPKYILDIIIKNFQKAENMIYPLCQDTGMAIVFLEIGQDVHLTGNFINDAVTNGVKDAYEKGFLRKSVVNDPLIRENSKNNLPPVIYTEIVKGDKIKITVLPKGFGAENQSSIKMMLPSTPIESIIDFIADTIITAGGKGCPPGIVGVGIGGTFEYSAFLAKKALLLPLDKPNPKPHYQKLEQQILEKINASNIGPLGTGGKTTVLGVKVLSYATHIAGLPIAINYCCHSCRHSSIII